MVETADIAIFVVLLILSAFFSGVEVAVVSINNLRARSLRDQGKRGANSLYYLKENPGKTIITILVGNNIANVGASAYATVIAGQIFQDGALAIAIGTTTLLLLIFGEITPKRFASTHSEKIALIVAPIIKTLEKLIWPVIWLLEKLTATITKIAQKEKKPALTEEDFKTLLKIGVEEKVFERQEEKFITGVLEFHDKSAKEVMTPRTRILCLNARLSVEDALKHASKTRFSRFPVIMGTKDKVVRVVNTKDLTKTYFAKHGKTKIGKIGHAPIFVSREENISSIFKELQRKNQQMAIVVDEYGGTEGIVTLENLTEEIVGEIHDESEVTPENNFRKLGRNKIEVHGELLLEDVEEYFKVDLPQAGDYTTVSGLLHHKLKRIPKKGSHAKIGKLKFKVENVKDNNLVKILITKNN
ncbi:MAG: hemolysin family protein [Candidatus Micrarchaeia archaeon]